MKKRSFLFRICSGLLLAVSPLVLGSCHAPLYRYPEFNFAGRVTPPSGLLYRVMIGQTTDGSISSLQILDGLNDLRSNIQNTVHAFFISGYSLGFPNDIINYPAETRGYVYSTTTGSVTVVDYEKESVSNTYTLAPNAGVAVPTEALHLYSGSPSTNQLEIVDRSQNAINPSTYSLNIPNLFQVVASSGDSVILAFARNSNAVYRVVKLNSNQPAPPGAIDCQPYNLPVYCAVPVNGGTFDRPTGALFSTDGSTVYIYNSGPEAGGRTASVTFLQLSPLNVNSIPTTTPDASAFLANVPVPGGVTDALSDGATLYVSGQQLQSDGLFAGRLSTINLTSHAVTATYSISDGNHSKMLFADDNTLWIGSQQCANGEREHQAVLGVTTQAANYNCLTRFDLGALSATIIPNAVQGTSNTVPYPNQDANNYYYGDLTGLCWVQNLHKVYTAYGGQVHAFNTGDGSEINNFYITITGTALDAAYMDALSDDVD